MADPVTPADWRLGPASRTATALADWAFGDEMGAKSARLRAAVRAVALSADEAEETQEEAASPPRQVVTRLTDGAGIARLGQAEPDADALHLEAFGPPLPNDALGRQAAPAPVVLPDLPPAPGVVVTAVIDGGLPFLNRAFQAAGGTTRVRYAWVQDGRFRHDGPSHVSHGREFTAAEIETLLADASRNGPYPDELAAYRAAGLADFARPRGHILGRASTHGAHVAALAGGYPPEDDRTDRPLIFVQLPHVVTGDTSGASLAPHVISALDYIEDRADRIAAALGCGRLPLVINLSYGGTGGPLDGTGFLERRMDAFLERRNRRGTCTAILLPAGNAHLSQGHARIGTDTHFTGPGRTETLSWKIQPSDHSDSFIEIWTPREAPGNRLEVALTTPGGAPGPFLPAIAGQAVTLPGPDGPVARISYRYVGGPTRRGCFTIAVAPTDNPGRPGPRAPAGVWTVTLRDTGLPAGSHVDAWILRDDEVPGHDNDARQSRFVDPRHGKAHCPVIAQGLQSAIATGRRTIVVGGFVDRSGHVARYSAGGATNTDDRPGPDALTVSDASRVHPGVISAGVLSGSRMPVSGSSVAVPQITRAVADAFAKGEQPDRAWVAAWAAACEQADFAGRAARPDAHRGGAGRIQPAPQDRRRYWPL
ncbi:hypothetical protein HMH01_00905 [Halovulum dunhuangense]|uniref:Subtilase family protein n=1 Tax=Halovulum dunhuangense TaxID=1505036 RepID=A0A849KZE1_9RHOB|nr:hypothetical protein [Halovulum dunhuangense]NNU78984.1 hypothetical protein [Halovulum dunhuangense]